TLLLSTTPPTPHTHPLSLHDALPISINTTQAASKRIGGIDILVSIMHDLRLGDEIDDFCIKCKRVTNHSIVSLVENAAAKVRCRSEEHTSELQSRSDLVCRLLLEKKK